MSQTLTITPSCGIVDFTRMKRNNISAVMIRCSHGVFENPTLAVNFKSAMDQSLIVGVETTCRWHYSSGCMNTYEEALINIDKESVALLQLLNNYPINGPVSLYMTIDLGMRCKLDRTDMTNALNYYCSILKEHGYTPIVHCSSTWLVDRICVDPFDYQLWVTFDSSTTDTATRNPGKSYASGVYAANPRLGNKKVVMWAYSHQKEGKALGLNTQYVELSRFDDPMFIYGVDTANVTPYVNQQASKKQFIGGERISLDKAPVFVMPSKTCPFGHISGEFFVYTDKILCGKIRITNKDIRYGETLDPIDVLGWVPVANISLV